MKLADRLLTLLGAISISVCALGAIVLSNPPGYEPSFYETIPTWFWFILVVGIVSGITLISRGASVKSTRLIRKGAAVVGSNYAILFFLPQSVGFRFWSAVRADALMHFAYVEAIVSSGFNTTPSMYPGTHFLIAQLSVVTGLRVEIFQPLVMYVVTVLFIIGCYLLIQQLADKWTAAFVLLSASPLVFNKYNQHLMPWFIAFSLTPIGFLLIDKFRTEGSRLTHILSTVLILGIVIIHPMSAIIFSVMIVVGYVSILSHNSFEGDNTPTYRSTWPFLIGIPFASWYLWTDTFARLFTSIVSSLLQFTPGAVNKATTAGNSGYTQVQLLWRYIVLDYGVLILYLFTGGVIAIWLAYRYLRGTRRETYTLVIIGIYVAGGSVGTVFLLIDAIVGQFYRLNQLTLLGSILLIGIGLSALQGYQESNQTRSGIGAGYLTYIIISVIMLSAILSPFMIFDERRHATEQEFAGVEQHVLHRNQGLHTNSMKVSGVLQTYAVGYHQNEELTEDSWAFRHNSPEHEIPSDLGYGTNDSISKLYQNDGYAVILERNTEWVHVEPANRKNDVSFVSEAERSQLSGDSGASLIYDNGGFSTWYISVNDNTLRQ